MLPWWAISRGADKTHFTFKVPGAPADDPGLHFVKNP